MIFWVFPRTCLLGFSCLYSTAATILGGHLMVLASPQHCCLRLQLGFINSLSYALFMVPSLNLFAWPLQSWTITITTEAAPLPMTFYELSQCWASAALHDPFMPWKPVPPGWLLHITKSSHSMRYNLGYLWNSFFVLPENNSQKILPQWCWSLLNHC